MSTSDLPLVAGFRADADIARHRDGMLTQGQYVAQVQRLASQLPASHYAINLCDNRYRFMLAFAAVCVRGQTNLLPSNATPDAIAELQARYPDSYVLRDAQIDDSELAPALEVPSIAADHPAALLFTSGSTGVPQPHLKTWAATTVIARHLAQRLLGGARAQIVATVPPQHMYGLETTVLMALAADCVVDSDRPFFPQDVAAALARMPAPRVLVTAPVHLRALLESDTRLPPLSFILSATAPLTLALAQACEAAWQVPLFEIYGCTEAGSTATRRTTEGERWRLLADMRLSVADGQAIVHAAHLPGPTPLQDRLELHDDEHFTLLGRNSDLLKVAGKRASLADLTQRLLAIPGVDDAVIFNAADGEAARLAALVVAPNLSEAAILAALATQIDAAFLPRPLRKVAQLPRNALGKLPRAVLLEWLARAT